MIKRAFYGGKSAGSDIWHHLRSCMYHLSFKSSKAYPDAWMRRYVRADGITPYYEYVLLYVDDCLVVSDRAESVIRNEIGKYFRLKEESIGDPSQYLGAKLRKIKLDNGAEA